MVTLKAACQGIWSKSRSFRERSDRTAVQHAIAFIDDVYCISLCKIVNI